MSAAVDNAFYDELGERWLHDREHAIALLAAEAPVKIDHARTVLGLTRRRVLDVGCGAGLVAVPLALDGHGVVGVDRSAATVDVARSLADRHDADAVFRVGDAERLEEPDASFDVVLLLDVLEHVEDAAAVVREAVRVVRPGGSIVFHTFTRNPLAYLVAVAGPRLITRDCPRHLHVYERFIRPRELRHAFAEAGASVVERRGVRPRIDAAFARTVRHRRVDPGFGFTCGGPVLAGYLGTAVRDR